MTIIESPTKSLLCILLLLLLSSCSERVIVSDADSLGLRFRVKTMNESFHLANNSFDNVLLHRKIYEYKYEFDGDCRFKTIEKKLFSAENEIFDPIADSLAADSKRSPAFSSIKDPEYAMIKFRYFADTALMQEFFDRRGNRLSYIEHRIRNGKPAGEEKYSDAGTLIYKAVFWYDSQNRLKSKTVFYPAAYSESQYVYSSGEKFEMNSDFNYRYKFDLEGKTVKKNKYSGTKLLSETNYSYNIHGDVVSERETSADGDLRKTLFEYTYDERNNWTVCVERDLLGNIFVKKREISYFPD
ncbi:MAG: hypothetical protein LBD35_04345 [Prevotellaceae bacterium]|jgi:hypothetical protein|nr:hypothetical protein [Prevotellaceae bacterium]